MLQKLFLITAFMLSLKIAKYTKNSKKLKKIGIFFKIFDYFFNHFEYFSMHLS